MRVTTSVTGHRLTVVVRLTTSVVARPGGWVAVLEGKHRLTHVRMVDGQARLVAKGMSSGTHRLKVRYAGTPKLLPVSTPRSVKVR